MPVRAQGAAPSRRARPRSSLGAASLVVLGLLLLGCGGTEAPLTSVTAQPQAFRITVAGDSIMRELSAPIEAALEQPGVEVDFALQPAIATPTLAAETELLLDEHDPDVLLMMIGTWEGIGVDTRVEGWEQRYTTNVLGPFVTQLAEAGTDVVWLGYPPFPASPEDLRHSQLNDAYASLPAEYPTVTFVDAGAAVSADDGTYVEAVDIPGVGVVPLRQTDGRHLCPDGAALMAEAVVAHVAERFGVTAVEGWQRAAWRVDPSNFEHPEQCPGLFPADAPGAEGAAG